MSRIISVGLLASVIITTVIVANPAYGHKLISHDGTYTGFDSALRIPDHRISWAVCDDLGTGGEKFYTIDAERGELFYAGILVPKIDGPKEYSPSLFLVGPTGFEEQSAPFGKWPNTERFLYGGEFLGDQFYEPFG